MIRKAIIVVLTLGAVGTAIAGLASQCGFPLFFGCNITDRHQLSVGFGYGHLQASHWVVVDAWEPSVHRIWKGFGYVTGAPHNASNIHYRCRKVHCPFWVPAIVLATYPSIAFIRGPIRRWRRQREGRCLRCGYDLTGNVSGVCPECGTKIEEP